MRRTNLHPTEYASNEAPDESGQASPQPAPSVTAAGDSALGGVANRRAFLLATVGVLLTGCSTARTTSTMPGPSWRVRRTPAGPPAYDSPPSPASPPRAADPVIARATWSPGTASPANMNAMNGIRHITVHHDGIGPFYDHDERSTRRRLESIRRFHREDHGWGDIGYHYIIDRNGRVWEGRSIQYQGAHVRYHNKHNVGVLLLGHFDQQSPSDRQIAALQQHVSRLMHRYNIPLDRVTTHREWETARTVCPGHTLQAEMDRIRRRGQLG